LKLQKDAAGKAGLIRGKTVPVSNLDKGCAQGRFSRGAGHEHVNRSVSTRDPFDLEVILTV
jgi:hypothetical protein